MKLAIGILALTLASGSVALATNVVGDGFTPVSSLPDLSGMAWMQDDTFLVVHDSKNPGELDHPRVSLMELPQDPQGLLWKVLPLKDEAWPGGKSSDLESVARIPGTQHVLMVESGDSGNPTSYRIFRARLNQGQLRIEAAVPWPVEVYNVESTAVAQNGDTFVFLYAERAQLKPSTLIRWATFNPVDLTFGSFQSVTLKNPDPKATNRPVVGMDIGPNGEIYTVAAYDAEAAGLPDPDNGPFASSVWMVGKVIFPAGVPKVTLLSKPKHMGSLDGMKVESVCVRQLPGQPTELFVGLDDENYGATLRKLPAPQ